MTKRALVIVLDSVGIGAARDAADYGDAGANTIRHILARVPEVELPTLRSLGLGRLLGEAGPAPQASYGRMLPRARGKDSTTGHWEIAGVPLQEPFGLFECFPPELIDALEREAGVRFIGNCRASGTQIIDDLGPRHMATGELILYTSADSVLQIAAHEGVFPLELLYKVCETARRLGDAYRIGRVIARPFTGEPGAFVRTGHRHDFSMRPPRTVLNAICDAGLPVVGVGKIGDLFAQQGVTRSLPTGSNDEGMATIEAAWREAREGLVFANLVDFDTEYGHRRDAEGYARALATFDRWLSRFLPHCGAEDFFILTADHGNDPTHRGTDHTRENVPVFVKYRNQCADLGERDTFADVAATLARFFGVHGGWNVGKPFEVVHACAKRTKPATASALLQRPRRPSHAARDRVAESSPHTPNAPRSRTPRKRGS